MSEKREAWMRIIVGIVSGSILEIWKGLIMILGVVNFFIVLFKNKRDRGIAEFSEIWNTQKYIFMRYMTFVTNERPFPFEKLSKNITKFKK